MVSDTKCFQLRNLVQEHKEVSESEGGWVAITTTQRLKSFVQVLLQ